MADTVKKSRIVSDEDNLEESLLEEFNLRLKNCMSQDNLQHSDEEQNEENSLYENLETVKCVKQNISKSGISSRDFIQAEKENYYEEPPIQKNDDAPKQNGHSENVSDVVILCEKSSHQEKTESKTLDQYVEMHPQTTYENLEVSPKITVDSQDYEDIDETEPNQDNTNRDDKENTYEVVEPKVSLTLNLTSSEDAGTELDLKSVKDRMFLSTDDTSCLLFTQTVTSPMLTPSEENIDFLKGFRRESSQNTASDNTNSNESPKLEDEKNNSDPFEENQTASEVDGDISTSEPIAAVVDEDEGISVEDAKVSQEENIYENAEFLKLNSENIYENLNVKENDNELAEDPVENIYENVGELKARIEETNNTEETNAQEPIYQTIEDVLENNENIYQNVEEVQIDAAVISADVANNEIVNISDNVEEENKEQINHEVENQSNNTSENIENVVETIEVADNLETENKEILDDAVTCTKVQDIAIVENYAEFVHCKTETNSNYYEKYAEVVFKKAETKETTNREKDTETVPPEIVKNLKNQFSKTPTSETVTVTKKEKVNSTELKAINIMKQINKFENKESEEGSELDDSTQITESYVETTTVESRSGGEKGLKKKKSKKSRKEEKENISVNENHINDGDNFYNVNVKNLCRSFGDLTKLGDDKVSYNRQIKHTKDRGKSSFSKFDALQKKNVLHVRSSDSAKAQEKFNGVQADTSNCKACSKAVFQMEQIKAEKSIWHKNCFRCTECNKQLNVDTYQSHEGSLYCKPHFKALFVPKAVEDEAPPKPRKPELIIRENQPLELPPDVVRASDKPDLGLEELHSLNVKERFQVFEHHQSETNELERNTSPINVKRSPSILSKLARFQAKGMDVGVADDSLNGIPIDESSSEEEQGEEIEGEDADLVRAKRVQKEKPFHFTGMSDVKNKWEHGEPNAREERREERKQEIQSIRNRLFMGKQGKMKEAYQQAVMESESCTNIKKLEQIESCDTKTIKERFEKGDMPNEKDHKDREDEDMEVFESEISKKSRSLFLELDANASKAPQISPVTPPKLEVKKAREAFLAKAASQDTIKSSEQVDDITVETADIQQRFKFFETYREPEKTRKQFRITPPREGQIKAPTPEREVYHDPDVVRSEEFVEDSVIAKETHTATKMLNKFRQMEENVGRDTTPAGLKPLKRFTPPPEPARPESSSEEESGSEEESEEDDEVDNPKIPDEDLLEAQKAARAKQLRAKFERWEASEIKKEQSNVNIVEEFGEEQSQIESTKSLRARFESMRDSSSDKTRTPRVKVNRFVEIPSITDTCESCKERVYPLEKITIHGHIYHKKCFKCMECSCVLRMDSYSYNQGLLYCTPHFKRLFITKGNYDSAFGLGQHKEKWNATMA